MLLKTCLIYIIKYFIVCILPEWDGILWEIVVLEWLRQENCKFESNLDYLVRDDVLKQKDKQKPKLNTARDRVWFAALLTQF